MGGSGSRSARQRRSDPSGQRRRGAALPASAARSEGRQRARRCSRRVRRCSCRSGTSRCRPNRSRSGSATSGFASSTNALTTFTLSTWQRDLSRAITDPDELLAELGLDAALAAPARAASSAFGAARHAQLSRAHAPRRRERSAAAPGAAARRRTHRDAGLRGRSACRNTKRRARPGCCRNTQAARCSSRPRPAPSIAATASGASFRIRRKLRPRKRAPRASAPRST